jgi:hypothetical protein
MQSEPPFSIREGLSRIYEVIVDFTGIRDNYKKYSPNVITLIKSYGIDKDFIAVDESKCIIRCTFAPSLISSDSQERATTCANELEQLVRQVEGLKVHLNRRTANMRVVSVGQ